MLVAKKNSPVGRGRRLLCFQDGTVNGQLCITKILQIYNKATASGILKLTTIVHETSKRQTHNLFLKPMKCKFCVFNSRQN